MPELHIVAGLNGVGKTTAFTTIVPQGLEYVNADMIAKTIREKSGWIKYSGHCKSGSSQNLLR